MRIELNDVSVDDAIKYVPNPVFLKGAFMPSLVSVFNRQPLHLVNYLGYCVKERWKWIKAFLL